LAANRGAMGEGEEVEGLEKDRGGDERRGKGREARERRVRSDWER
jgi:hypothetical protein